MFGSSALEVAIGLAFVFLLLSLICTSLTELIARAFAMRSRMLWQSIRELLGEDPEPPKGWSGLVTLWREATGRPDPLPAGGPLPGVNQAPPKGWSRLVSLWRTATRRRPPSALGNILPTDKLYGHPLIAGLTGRTWMDMVRDRMGRPSYIPSRTFALALLDNFAPPASSTSPNSFWDIRQQVVDKSKTGSPEEQKAAKALLPLLDAAGQDLKVARENVEKWFDDAMARVSGWYKRRTQLVILFLALAVAGGFNADTFMIASAFSTDASLRTAVVNAAQQVAEKATKPEDVAKSFGEAQAQLDTLRIPVGWTRKPGETCNVRDGKGELSFGKTRPCNGYGWFMKIVGLILTAVALTLGAPFWFDTLSKLVNLRSSGAKPTKEAAQGTTANTT